MKYELIEAKLGDSIKINDLMSVRFEKIADDLGPVWHEVPPEPQNKEIQEGNYIKITDDVWFVHDKGSWRMMSHSEHVEAYRQLYSKKIKNADHSSQL